MRDRRTGRRRSRCPQVAVAVLLVAAVTALPGAPAGAVTGSVVPSGSPANVPRSSFKDIACPSDTSCVAVGDFANVSGTHPLAEQWDGTRWSVMPVPFEDGGFESVACPTTTMCIALVTGGPTPHVDRWDGTTWSTEPLAALEAGAYGSPASISCVSTTSCVAVGAKSDSSNAPSGTLIESWDGATWSIVDSPSVAGGNNRLSGVACTDPAFCVAVGSVYKDAFTSGKDYSTTETIIEQWDGTSWSIAENTAPAGTDRYRTYNDVSCSSESSCFAVGGYDVDFRGRTLIEAWDGNAWSAVAGPNVPEISADNLFTGVSCTSDTSCAATGTSTDRPFAARGFIARWDGTSWSFALGKDGKANVGTFAAVSCSSASSCYATADHSSRSSQVAEHWNGSSWSATANPPVEITPSNATLVDVSCATATKCFGVGHYTQNTGRVVTLVESPGRAGWSVVASPYRADLRVNMLSSVSCPNATTCFAVGWSGWNGLSKTLVERWNGTKWSIVPSPNVRTSARLGIYNQLSGVSCSSATSCFAVGTSDYYNTLTERWDGKTWSVVPSPNRLKLGENSLVSVSCTSPARCFAVGRTSPTTGVPQSSYRTFTERWDGNRWAIVASPNASLGSGDLADVSCTSDTACVAVGSSYGNSSRTSLIETWNGAVWARVANADPVGATHSALTSVSCASATSCVAVGNDSGSEPLVKALSGGSWSIVPGVSPPGARNAKLHGVSCTVGTTCFAVGDYDTNGAPLTLVERYS